ncbi:membrane protein [Salmonella enterica subsp. salamae]|uniref:Membrane protein n=1 Tax=Salmonella enterica subsp. salamae TaxID=59202 RepID=A0A6D2G989_SALER|nr:membrane protein [Salmonella enterica subsp. salamae]
MTAEGHLLFSIASAVFAKNAELTPVLAHGDWWHIIPSAILTCLLPDIDHPQIFSGSAPEMDIETDRPSVRSPGVYP